jgi:membrane protein implicated in regulation of membrane protease activity
MTASPMRRWQNAFALLAVVLAAVALLPLAPAMRIASAGLAIVALLFLLAMRLRAHSARRNGTRTTSTYERIARLREGRAKRRS